VNGKCLFVNGKQGFENMKHDFAHIIECLVNGDKERAISYAEHALEVQKKKYDGAKTIWNKYDMMTAANVLHVLKGEPKEGGVAVLDGMETYMKGN